MVWKSILSRRSLSGGRAKGSVATTLQPRTEAIIFHPVLEFGTSVKGNPNRPSASVYIFSLRMVQSKETSKQGYQ